MAKNRGIQTFEKRRRERDRQMKQQAKLVERLERRAKKRAARLAGDDQNKELALSLATTSLAMPAPATTSLATSEPGEAQKAKSPIEETS